MSDAPPTAIKIAAAIALNPIRIIQPRKNIACAPVFAGAFGINSLFNSENPVFQLRNFIPQSKQHVPSGMVFCVASLASIARRQSPLRITY